MRIMVVEDEFLVGIQLEDDLRSAGYSVVGPMSSLDTARRAAATEWFDLAILDINVKGEMVYPLADELSARGVPIILLSGYALENLPDRFRQVPLISKPHDPAKLIAEVRRASTDAV